MDDDADVAPAPLEDRFDGRRIANVDRRVGVARLGRTQRVDLPARARRRAEEIAPHVVVDPDDVHPTLSETPHGLRADKPARSGDDGDGHVVVSGRLVRERAGRV